jgi:hypothetical protein
VVSLQARRHCSQRVLRLAEKRIDFALAECLWAFVHFGVRLVHVALAFAIRQISKGRQLCNLLPRTKLLSRIIPAACSIDRCPFSAGY